MEMMLEMEIRKRVRLDVVEEDELMSCSKIRWSGSRSLGGFSGDLYKII